MLKLTYMKKVMMTKPIQQPKHYYYDCIVDDAYLLISKNETILTCLERNKIATVHGCRNGHCGICDGYTLIAGKVKYKSENIHRGLLICKAYATENIELISKNPAHTS